MVPVIIIIQMLSEPRRIVFLVLFVLLLCYVHSVSGFLCTFNLHMVFPKYLEQKVLQEKLTPVNKWCLEPEYNR